MSLVRSRKRRASWLVQAPLASQKSTTSLPTLSAMISRRVRILDGIVAHLHLDAAVAVFDVAAGRSQHDLRRVL